MREGISTPDAPAAIGPYSQAIRAHGFIFVSGQIPLDPASGKLVGGDIAKQTGQVLANLQAILKASGSALDKAVRTTVYLKDMNEFAAMNAVYEHAFPGTAPARSTIEVARLPKDVRVEIDVIAVAE